MAALTITNEEAIRLAEELAAREGVSVTTVVIEALREKRDREPAPRINQERVNYFLELGRQVRESADPAWLERDPFEDLYDEDGLPK